MDVSSKEPLLGQRQRRHDDIRDSSSVASTAAAVNTVFLKRIWRLMCIAQCGNSLLLIILSVLEVALLSQAGFVIGRFYNALISKNSKLFLETVGQYLLWYSAEAICTATKKWAAEWIAIKWRMKLTQAAHDTYCSGPSLRRLSQKCYPVDNPDERVTNEIDSLCQALGQFMQKTIAAPLMILYYSWWVAYHVGWFGPVVVYAFFAAGATLTRWIISPIANLVARQEKLEAFFRISHVRFHASAEAIAMSDSGNYEKAILEDNLQAALTNRKKLVLQHFWLELTTKAYDYLGGALNYCVLAIPVFGGIFDSADSGQLANLISNAAFAVLQLIYSFSQVMDCAKLVSDLAGYTSRVGEFFEVLEILPRSKDSSGPSTKKDDISPVLEVEVLDARTSEGDLEGRQEIYLISPPTRLSLDKGRTTELSVHFAPPSLHEKLGRVFPGIASGSLLIVPVFETSLTSITASKDNETSGHGEQFAEVMLCVRERLRDLGHWTRVLDPCTGTQLFYVDQGESKQQDVGPSRVFDVSITTMSGSHSVSTKEDTYNQADAVKILLGYSSIKVGSVSVIDHPLFGHNCLLLTIFTTAPVKVFHSVLRSCVQDAAAALGVDIEARGNELLRSLHTPKWLTTSQLPPALIVDHMTCVIPGSHTLVVENLKLQLQWGDSLLVMGPTGSGKTSLLRTLCGLWRLQSGKIQIPPMLNGKVVFVLPQQPLLARVSLAKQILYPEPFPAQGNLSPIQISSLRHALDGVGLLYLLKQLNDDWEMERDWADTLSPGEQQSLALARILYHRPQFVILDEATNALSEDAEDAIYQQMIVMGISIISVGHQRRLIRYHKKLLVLLGDGKGGWSLS